MEQEQHQAGDGKTAGEDALRVRIADARKRRAVAESKREARRDASELLEQAKAAEMEAADEEAIEAAELEYGADKISAVRTSIGCVIVKRPNNVIFKQFRDKGDAKTVDLYKLVCKSLAHPDADKFDVMIDEQPAILDRAANHVATLAGFREKEVSGK